MNFNQQAKLLLTSMTLAFSMNAMSAPNYAAVDKQSCHRMQNSTQPFILVLSSGDDLIESITQCASDAKLMAASVSGLGQLHNPTLAYFSSDPKEKPTLTSFEGYFELASLNGNITNNADQYYTHLHTTLADKDFRGLAGHVHSATVGLTVEVTIVPFFAPIERTVDAETGFGPIVTH
jgi:predicted DNA-binding protein with PD1-like motif